MSGVKEIEQNHRFGGTERDCLIDPLISLFGQAELRLRVTNFPSSALDVIHGGRVKMVDSPLLTHV